MENRNRDYIPGQWREDNELITPTPAAPKPPKKRFTIVTLISLLCLTCAVTMLLTYTFTANSERRYYSERLAEQQRVIEQLQNEGADFEQLELLRAIIANYSYYAGQVSEEELLNAVLKAYAKATGDAYAEYYTDAEYAELTAENVGEQVGIGISIIQTSVEVNSVSYDVLQIIAVFRDGTAYGAGVQVGDCIYSVKTEEGYQSVSSLGYTKALALLKGEKGTHAEFAVLRPENGGYTSKDFRIVRDDFESVSVTHTVSESDPTVAIVRISNFDITTPNQFKETVKSLLSDGIEHFVFDLRNNPGGDLQSIKAVLTYFLQPGDLILSAIDREGQVARSYVAEAMQLTGDYAPCSVAAEEIGMFADLDMAVICNGNTASAAEVFVATMRDYGLADIVGETTFGKGIMQSFLPLSLFDPACSGYIKLTTYAYVTKCGVTYHEIGISPDEGCEVSLSEEAKKYNFYVLPQSLDDQLIMAVAQFQ